MRTSVTEMLTEERRKGWPNLARDMGQRHGGIKEKPGKDSHRSWVCNIVDKRDGEREGGCAVGTAHKRHQSNKNGG